MATPTTAGAAESGKKLETVILHKVGEVVSAINDAKDVDRVICTLYSLAVLLFPLEFSSISGSLSKPYEEPVREVSHTISAEDRKNWWEIFYRGGAFPTLSRVLLHDVACSWLACFPLSAQKHVYDVFFENGLSTEVVQVLDPCLTWNGDNDMDTKIVRSNAERLLVLCLLDKNGMYLIAKEYSIYWKSETCSAWQLKPIMAKVAQRIISIPDKIRPRSPTSLSSHFFFKKIIRQLLDGAESMSASYDGAASTFTCHTDGSIVFIGEVLVRVCRRGFTEVIVGEIVPQLLGLVKSSNLDLSSSVDVLNSIPGGVFWSIFMEIIKDPYTFERLSEQLLHKLAIEHASDEEAYWIFWILFQRTFHEAAVRAIFLDKFLLWKVFPICCLRWILQYFVLASSPAAIAPRKIKSNQCLIDMVRRLVAVWCKREFVQSAPLEQQAYITAALGLSVEKMSKEELDSAVNVLHSLLQGVSCRLESPDDLTRKMGSAIALTFSRVVDPNNPLYLDDSCNKDIADWEFGLNKLKTPPLPSRQRVVGGCNQFDASPALPSRLNLISCEGVGHVENRKFTELNLMDPDEIIDPASINNAFFSEGDRDEIASSNMSQSSADESLEPYDLSDDDTDLKRNFSQLTEIIGALRKTDDPDGVQGALDVVEKLVRASPEEVIHVGGDLTRVLVQVKCSDIAVEGEEEAAEEKRQKALVALLVTCPFQSLDTIRKLLYSSNVDTSQRMLMIDVMTDAAEELAATKTLKLENETSNKLISVYSENQPWFVPSCRGPLGSGTWKKVSDAGTLLNYSYHYERELPSKHGLTKGAHTRRWSVKLDMQNKQQWTKNKFPLYAAAFMLPFMEGFDKKRHGVDLLGSDFIVLGQLIHMLGVCMKCVAWHPEASALAPPLLDLLRYREVFNHKEAYVRRSVLFAAACILLALHPSYVASNENLEISEGLEWVRVWAIEVVESDADKDCYAMGMKCLQLHAEMALQASRAMDSLPTTFQELSIGGTVPSIKIPRPSIGL